MIGPELFLSGPSAVDQALCATDRSTEGLIPVASNVVDILLCYLKAKARPSPAAARTVSTALTVYADALPQEGASHDTLGKLAHELLGFPLGQTADGGARNRQETSAHLLRAIASGIPSMQPCGDITQLLRDLCLQLHLCNFLQCIRTLSVLNYVDRHSDSLAAASSQLFLKQVARYLNHIVRNTDSPAISWEYKLHLFAVRQRY